MAISKIKGNLREWIIAVAILTFSLFTIFYLIPAQIEITEEYELKSLSPAFFPEVAAWIVTGLAILLMINLYRTRAHPKEALPAMNVSEECRVLAVMAIAGLYVLAFKYLGFIPSSCVGLAVLFWLQGKRRIFRLAILSVGTAVLVYLVFYYAMKVRFSEGIWFR